ncbi:hypothetical protein [Plantactinospora sp. KLBMP9567]|uniref:hypothetical protein n=1 Tax=Plantactinospora sp. KLBMP9567 TaxID=3085900 RepID=UPI00298119B8|nr:hypothetical protein [Plantactinospora sp. KLBMP9567]MDW5329549.1 hypothetical protein [Plantactinospora sp. KLBMP9567]
MTAAAEIVPPLGAHQVLLLLTTTSYAVLILVAIVTSVMAPPMLRWAMGRIRQNPQEADRLDRLAAWTEPPR